MLVIYILHIRTFLSRLNHNNMWLGNKNEFQFFLLIYIAIALESNVIVFRWAIIGEVGTVLSNNRLLRRSEG